MRADSTNGLLDPVLFHLPVERGAADAEQARRLAAFAVRWRPALGRWRGARSRAGRSPAISARWRIRAGRRRRLRTARPHPESFSRSCQVVMIQQRGRQVRHLQRALGVQRVQRGRCNASTRGRCPANRRPGRSRAIPGWARCPADRTCSGAQEMVHQQRNVFLALAQRGQADGEDVEAVEQVQPEAARGHFGA